MGRASRCEGQWRRSLDCHPEGSRLAKHPAPASVSGSVLAVPRAGVLIFMDQAACAGGGGSDLFRSPGHVPGAVTRACPEGAGADRRPLDEAGEMLLSPAINTTSGEG